MPNYKKKKHGIFSSQHTKTSQKQVKRNYKNDDIEMTPSTSKTKKESKRNMRVVRGKKYDIKKRLKRVAFLFCKVSPCTDSARTGFGPSRVSHSFAYSSLRLTSTTSLAFTCRRLKLKVYKVKTGLSKAIIS